ncbi:hypothetical protein DsansV1_C25g0187381 [Dioscorea sansibarensis]
MVQAKQPNAVSTVQCPSSPCGGGYRPKASAQDLISSPSEKNFKPSQYSKGSMKKEKKENIHASCMRVLCRGGDTWWPRHATKSHVDAQAGKRVVRQYSMICSHSLRAVRGVGRTSSLPCSPPPPPFHRSTVLSFQVKSSSKDQDQDMEPKNQQQPNRDVMYDSFGEGYGTRSDEEGFGGIYGGNQEFSKENEPKRKHGENFAEYDTSQGSEVKEKEKARHQPHVKSE